MLAGHSHGEDLTIQHKSRDGNNAQRLCSVTTIGFLPDLNMQGRKLELNLLSQCQSRLLRDAAGVDEDFKYSHAFILAIRPVKYL